ncbi:hypothetical protein SASPL_134037 [Salvia splendens]|uniref:Uncharacterized protein n=1 Tax=Salvia splendens TaxID=180675 RepID=A0A8X8X450_SALSN|nr:uncharacterized protein LOC121758842 [Salvia splendens]KAG6406435.1 hypothetical protein SASPL_134037 [Salvia splendens]
MGSLMAGWGSNVKDPKAVSLTRNKSLTKDEIDAFWKSKKLKEEEHLRDISLLSPRTQKMIFEEAVDRCEGANGEEAEKNLLLQKNGWWISSNWAFLNEPPVIRQEGIGQKYVSQFHVADVAGSTSRTGISSN